MIPGNRQGRALWGSKYVSISREIVHFFADCRAGTLPHVAFVDPKFIGEEDGISWDDHPPPTSAMARRS
jgi:phospholipase C